MQATAKKMILVVDDDERLLMSTMMILEDEGYSVHITDKSLGTTNLIKELNPDLVLLDINMPGLSGESLAKVIKSVEKTRNIAIAFHSSNDEDSLRKAATAHGVKGYICKGDVSQLKRKVAAYLASDVLCGAN